jgi:hypothetical protein
MLHTSLGATHFPICATTALLVLLLLLLLPLTI